MNFGSLAIEKSIHALMNTPASTVRNYKKKLDMLTQKVY